MKDLFKGYYKHSTKEFDDLWKNAIFIFDTNALLNLYRYTSSTSSDLLKLMEEYADKVWIPYHVALEFQRNRLKVIDEQYKRFDKVRDAIVGAISSMSSTLNERHSHIKSDKILKQFEKAKDDYFKELDGLSKDCLTTSSEDKIRDRLDKIFKNRVGEVPTQVFIDAINKEGSGRFEKKIPPGYKDDSKKNGDEGYTYAGINYERKYGDLIIWKQILEHVKNQKLKDVIFITDDAKSDWWLEMNGETMGPRSELTGEITAYADVKRFHMYNTANFLSYANHTAKAKVNESAINDVKEVFDSRQYIKAFHGYEIAEEAVFIWLSKQYSHVAPARNRFVDFVALYQQREIGIEVKTLSENVSLAQIQEVFLRVSRALHYIPQKSDFDEVMLVLVVPSPKYVQAVIEKVKAAIDGFTKLMHIKLTIIIGTVQHSSHDKYQFGSNFIPFDQIVIIGSTEAA